MNPVMRDAEFAAVRRLAEARLQSGDWDGAIVAYAKCMTFAAHDAALANNYGVALIKRGRYSEAIPVLESALAVRPQYLRALVNLGKALFEAGRGVEADARLRAALGLDPDYLPALLNLAEVRTARGELDAAADCLRRAIRLSPSSAEAHAALGIVHLQAGNVAESMASLHTAVSISPEHADAHSNLAHALFCTGDWERAWPHFEYRFRRAAHRLPLMTPAGAPPWDGTQPTGAELLLVGEQGLGDQIQFARYAKTLNALAQRCVIACDARLVRLFRNASLCAAVVPLGTPASHPDARWMPLMSAPAWHRTRPDTVPFITGYLSADPGLVARWRALFPRDGGFRVALAWSGNPRMETGRYAGRSPSLAAFAPLLAVPGVEFISLQKGPGEEQLEMDPFAARIRRLAHLDDGPDAFMDTAAILTCVDLLITSDSAIAHLAGALGIPCWLCLLREPDWRWMREGDSTPWYSSLRLFRQTRADDWRGVFERVAASLAVHAVRGPSGAVSD